MVKQSPLNAMKKYQCYYLEDGRPLSEGEFEVPDDAAALWKAEGLLKESRFIAMEIFDGERIVGRVTVGSPEELGNIVPSRAPDRKK